MIEDIAIPHQIINITENMCKKILNSPQKFKEIEVNYAKLFQLVLSNSKNKFYDWFKEKYSSKPEDFYKDNLEKFLERAKKSNINKEIDEFFREHLLFLIANKEITNVVPAKDIIEKLQKYANSQNLKLCKLLLRDDINLKDIENIIIEIINKNDLFEEKIYLIYFTWFYGNIYEDKKGEILIYHYKLLRDILSILNKEVILEIENATPQLRIYLIKFSMILYFCNYEFSISLNKMETINYIEKVIGERNIENILSDVLHKTLRLGVPRIEMKISISYRAYVLVMLLSSILLIISYYFNFPQQIQIFLSILLPSMLVYLLYNIWELKEKIIKRVRHDNARKA